VCLEPLVTVVTPVSNAERFLAECMESVVGQTYTHVEYIVLDDGSTDASLEIALKYARQDRRVRVEHNPHSLGVMESHNAVFRLISPAAKYCKVVAPDNFLFPECIRRLVEAAEMNPSVGIVGSYQLSGSRVQWQGFKYPAAVIPGREICRQMLLGSQSGFGFGSPTSILYRAGLIRAENEFYPHAAPHSDASACFKCLEHTDFGFVYQVLSVGRAERDVETAKSKAMNRYVSAYLRDLTRYGPIYLHEAELERRLREQLNEYDRFLAANALSRRGKAFWDYHRTNRAELGFPIRPARVLKAWVAKAFREALNPGHAIEKCRRSVAGDQAQVSH
jgi:glycosyltransferase involved in cell wall biosynthesis